MKNLIEGLRLDDSMVSSVDNYFEDIYVVNPIGTQIEIGYTKENFYIPVIDLIIAKNKQTGEKQAIAAFSSRGVNARIIICK